MLVKFHILHALPKLAVYTDAELLHTTEFQMEYRLISRKVITDLQDFLMGSVKSCAPHMQTCAQKQSSHPS